MWREFIVYDIFVALWDVAFCFTITENIFHYMTLSFFFFNFSTFSFVFFERKCGRKNVVQV